MPRRTDSRSKMVHTAARLFRHQGYAATGWRQVIAASETPWGSQAHHFPDGKEQLAVEALAAAAEEYAVLLRHAFGGTDPAEAIRLWSRTAADQLKRSGWLDGCPVATVALETAGQSDGLSNACDGAFARWRDVLAQALAEAGLDDADEVSLLVLAGMEGGLLLARAARDVQPLRSVGNQLADLVEAKLSV